jgi:hypothetical protein
VIHDLKFAIPFFLAQKQHVSWGQSTCCRFMTIIVVSFRYICLSTLPATFPSKLGLRLEHSGTDLCRGEGVDLMSWFNLNNRALGCNALPQCMPCRTRKNLEQSRNRERDLQRDPLRGCARRGHHKGGQKRLQKTGWEACCDMPSSGSGLWSQMTIPPKVPQKSVCENSAFPNLVKRIEQWLIMIKLLCILLACR